MLGSMANETWRGNFEFACILTTNIKCSVVMIVIQILTIIAYLNCIWLHLVYFYQLLCCCYSVIASGCLIVSGVNWRTMG